jgi:DNA-directed RNA polymerase subunit H (RpoH/RPB5)
MNFSHEIANSIRVIYEMLKDRGYEEEDIAQLKSVSEHESHHQMRFHILLKDICVFYDLNQKFSRDIVDSVNNIDSPHFIFVIKASVTTSDSKKLMCIENKTCEIFSLLELQFNKTKHFLVPKHELIKDEKQIEELVRSHNIKFKSQFPHILRTDPMCKYLNAQPGNIVKIYRISPTSAESIIYRTVV